MFGIGLPELFLIAAIALVFIGPQKLPSALKALGRGLVEFKRATNEVRDTIQTEMQQIEQDIKLKDIKEEVENNFGAVANSTNPLTLSKMSAGKKLETLGNLLEKDRSISQSEVVTEPANKSSPSQRVS